MSLSPILRRHALGQRFLARLRAETPLCLNRYFGCLTHKLWFFLAMRAERGQIKIDKYRRAPFGLVNDATALFSVFTRTPARIVSPSCRRSSRQTFFGHDRIGRSWLQPPCVGSCTAGLGSEYCHPGNAHRPNRSDSRRRSRP